MLDCDCEFNKESFLKLKHNILKIQDDIVILAGIKHLAKSKDSIDRLNNCVSSSLKHSESILDAFQGRF